MATFFSFFQSFGGTFCIDAKWIIKFLRSLNEGLCGFLTFKKVEIIEKKKKLTRARTQLQF